MFLLLFFFFWYFFFSYACFLSPIVDCLAVLPKCSFQCTKPLPKEGRGKKEDWGFAKRSLSLAESAAMLCPTVFLLLSSNSPLYLLSKTAFKSSSAMVIKAAVNAQCYLKELVGLLREVLAVGLFPLCWEVGHAQYPPGKASVVCGPSIEWKRRYICLLYR